VNGQGSIVFSRVGARTVPTSILAESPLRFLTPKNDGPSSWAYASSFGGGLVDGDSVAMRLSVDEGASALFGTQASTKVYRGTSNMTLDARVQERALLAVLPDPVVCFAGATYSQRISISLAPSASLVLVDALTAGRSARGERWAFARYESTLRIDRPDGACVLLDPVRLDAAESDVAPRFGRFDVIATIVLLGPKMTDAASALLAEIAARPLERRGEAIVTASPLADGAIVRIVATSSEILAVRARAMLSFLPALLGDDPWARKF
jgi:urease accessory protein